LNKLFYRINNQVLKLIIDNRRFTIFILFVVLIAIFQFLPEKIIGFQNDLKNIVVELIGALVIVLISDFYIYRLIYKSSYPKTKEFVYGGVTSALSNISRDFIFNFLNIHNRDSESIKYCLYPHEDSYNVAIDILKLYTKNEEREKLITKYNNLINIEVDSWYHSIVEQREKLKIFIDNAHILKPKDIDLSEIVRINYRLFQIEKELKKSRKTREQNSGFIASYVSFISESIISTMESGLYSHWCIPKHINTVMERTDE